MAGSEPWRPGRVLAGGGGTETKDPLQQAWELHLLWPVGLGKGKRLPTVLYCTFASASFSFL